METAGGTEPLQPAKDCGAGEALLPGSANDPLVEWPALVLVALGEKDAEQGSVLGKRHAAYLELLSP